MLRRIPIDVRVKTNDEPPKLINGSVIPVMGRIPTATPIFIIA